VLSSSSHPAITDRQRANCHSPPLSQGRPYDSVHSTVNRSGCCERSDRLAPRAPRWSGYLRVDWAGVPRPVVCPAARNGLRWLGRSESLTDLCESCHGSIPEFASVIRAGACPSSRPWRPERSSSYKPHPGGHEPCASQTTSPGKWVSPTTGLAAPCASGTDASSAARRCRAARWRRSPLPA